MQEELAKRVLSLPIRAGEIQIKDQITLSTANEFLLGIKALQKEIDSTFDPIVQAANEAHKKALVQKKKFEDPLIQAEKIIKGEIGRYLAEQEKIRREAIEKARQEAAEAERRQLEAMQAAIDAENVGKIKEAEEKFEEAMAVAPPKPVIPEAVKVQGTFLRKELKWRIVDLAAVPREFLALDQQKVEAQFRLQREKMSIPGIETYISETVVSRST